MSPGWLWKKVLGVSGHWTWGDYEEILQGGIPCFRGKSLILCSCYFWYTKNPLFFDNRIKTNKGLPKYNN